MTVQVFDAATVTYRQNRQAGAKTLPPPSLALIANASTSSLLVAPTDINTSATCVASDTDALAKPVNTGFQK